ncbi:MAG: 50S ribosomal protein L32 [Deltaproteobacteria bacterium]|nr:50S ribosomal protein L32 [Deltaproteobacteria bacterium]
MAVPKRKVSKSKKNLRRSHDGLQAPGISLCSQCKEPKAPHRVCPNCGTYKGKEVIEQKEE